MSHFVVLVIGDDVEGQLAPYDENMPVDPYWKDEAFQPIDHWRYRTLLEEGTITEMTTIEEYAAVLSARYSDEGSRYRVDHGVLQVETAYNPKSQWDWWVVGGRWSDMLRKFDGTACDEGQILEIDWAGMELEVAQRAEKRIDAVLALVKDLPPPRRWEDVLGAHPGDIDAAREEYHSQPAIKAISGDPEVRVFMENAEDFYHLLAEDPKVAYIQSQIENVPNCYAYVKDGEWFAMGEMGWFGMSNDTVEESVWRKQVRDVIKANPGEHITVVDCHI